MLNELQQYKTLNRYLLRSLRQRVTSESWFENKVIRYVLQQSPWVKKLEATFQAADLDSVPNSGEIFGVLRGTAQDYDEKLFDALAEVRLVAWARGRGYQQVTKLEAGAGHTTPDFHMEKDGRVFLAEAKHFQVRDWLVYFVADRLEGLALKTGMLTHSGLSVEMASKYSQQRDNILANRASWRAKARQALTEAEFLSWVQSLPNNEDAQIEIMDGLFALEHSKHMSPGRVSPAVTGTFDPKETARLRLDRLESELKGKLTQIKRFMDATGAHADQAVVFFSGIDEWEPEWSSGRHWMHTTKRPGSKCLTLGKPPTN